MTTIPATAEFYNMGIRVVVKDAPAAERCTDGEKVKASLAVHQYLSAVYSLFSL